MEFHYNNLVDTLAQFVACITHYMMDYFVPTLDIKKPRYAIIILHVAMAPHVSFSVNLPKLTVMFLFQSVSREF